MAYFPDLSAYSYSREKDLLPWRAVVLNVGWLASDQPFPTGPCPPDFVARLRERSQAPVALMRGNHHCEFCPPPVDWERTPHGNGEVRVRGKGRVIYAAPVLVVHYVEGHQYRPPEEFIAAVLGTA